MDTIELLEKFGPYGVLTGIAVFLIYFITSNYKADIESRLTLGNAIDRLTDKIERLK